MARGKAHDPKLKAQIIARVVAGESASAVSKDTGLDKSLIGRWVAMAPRLLESLPQQRQEDLGVLLDAHLVKLLLAMNAQLEKMSEPGWIQRQDAHDMAILFGVEQDKFVRLLGAKQRAEERGSAEPARADDADGNSSVLAQRSEDPDQG